MICLRRSFINAATKCGQTLQGRLFKTMQKLERGYKSGYGLEAVEGSNKLYFYKIDEKNRMVIELGENGEFFLFDIWDHEDKSFNLKKRDDMQPSVSEMPRGTGIGFSPEDFRILDCAFKIPGQISEKQYFEKICDQIFPKFDFIAKNISSRLYEELGVRLFPHKAEMGDIGKGPVTWLAFTRSNDEHYQNYAQLTLHLGIGDCTHETSNFDKHFCIKLAVFHDKHDIRAFWRNLENHPDAIDLMKKYARKLNRLYEMKFYRRKKNPPIVFPTHTNDDTYTEVFVDLMSPESISEDFFGFSFSRYYPYYENRNQEKFSDIKWVEDEIINEFSDLMYLYFMFSDDAPIQKIEHYKKRKIDFDNKRMSDRQHPK